MLQGWANASNTTQAAHRSCLDHSVCLRNATAHARRHKYQRESPSQPNTSAKDATETLTQYSLKGNCVVSANSCSKSIESNRETYFVCSKKYCSGIERTCCLHILLPFWLALCSWRQWICLVLSWEDSLVLSLTGTSFRLNFCVKLGDNRPKGVISFTFTLSLALN